MSSPAQICSQAAEQLYAADFWHSMHYTVAMASSSHQHTTTQQTAKGRMWQAAANCWKSPGMATVPRLLQPPSTSPNFQKADLVWPADTTSQWRDEWQSVSVANNNLISDPIIRLPGFNLGRSAWSMLNRFPTEQGRCAAKLHKRRMASSDKCQCGSVQTMSHIVVMSAN